MSTSIVCGTGADLSVEGDRERGDAADAGSGATVFPWFPLGLLSIKWASRACLMAGGGRRLSDWFGGAKGEELVSFAGEAVRGDRVMGDTESSL